ncbi:hypothetical protein BU23DRAFT_3124 [Bimuria novae-zelandiae CBS 107.79]|uniref:HD domain-containing protein n=1 Tax=Bimuria novae-zelandiae CBS 107.79 TaxID=1447943 RepID=A0A6A5VS29_9PLEO|nr:hypothetical protein BU23DRAFT_3124 [Bimuria novae-zelandiae CBS 107.79]
MLSPQKQNLCSRPSVCNTMALSSRSFQRHLDDGSIPPNIRDKYNEPGRAYHNLNHIRHMLNLIPSNRRRKRELTYATWFHDCVYDPKAKHGRNERDSIRLWEEHVEDCGCFISDIKDIVSLMIECTITHTLPSDISLGDEETELLKRFLDMDMDILASPRAEYLDYAEKVRKEYSHFTDEQFRKGRIEFFRGELKKEKVFYLEENERKNGIAMENMKAEIEMLESEVARNEDPKNEDCGISS